MSSTTIESSHCDTQPVETEYIYNKIKKKN